MMRLLDDPRRSDRAGTSPSVPLAPDLCRPDVRERMCAAATASITRVLGAPTIRLPRSAQLDRAGVGAGPGHAQAGPTSGAVATVERAMV